MNHSLSLDIPDTRNTCVLRVVDTSLYGIECIDVKCPTLQITPPGFLVPVDFNVDAGFCNINVTACDLNLQTSHCGETYMDLPDGLYVVRYSVSPNEEVFVEYNHLRVTELLNTYSKLLCELKLSGCQPEKEVDQSLDKLYKIKMYIDAAKAAVEICHDAERGLAIYDYAKKLLSKLTCKNC